MSSEIRGTELDPVPGRVDPTQMDGPDHPAVDDSTYIAHNLPSPLAESYRILRRLGLGGQGSVYLCERLDDGRQVAIKLYSVAMTRLDPGVIEKLASSPAEHIVPTEFGQWGEECWEIQEYLPLGTVADIRDHFGGELPDSVALEIVGELAEAVASAHAADLLHRDIKPSNILIRSLQPLDLVLADFGLVRNLVAGAQLGSRSATPGYRSPDTAQGIWRLESDWWAVGITLYEVLCQRHPFDDENGNRRDDITILGYLVENDVPLDDVSDPRWRLLLRGLLTKSADHRWGIEQVRDWLAGGSPPVHHATRTADRAWAFAGFAGQTFTSTEELGRAMAARWDEAAEYLNGRGRTALYDALAQSTLAAQVHQVFERHEHKLIRTDGLLFELIRLLTPEDDLVFRGRPLTADGLAAVAGEAAGRDAAAVAWIRTLRSEHVLANTMGDPHHLEFVRIDEQLGAWWEQVDRRVDELREARRRFEEQALAGRHEAANIDAGLTWARDAWEGELLRCALSSDYVLAVQQAGRRALDKRGETADWVGRLAAAVRGQEPAPVDALLLTTLLPQAGDDHALAQEVEAEHRRQQEAAEQQRLRDERRAQMRRALPNGGDGAVVAATVALCLTVLVPWVLGVSVLRGEFGRDESLVAVDGARKLGAYVVTDWLAGSVVILAIAAAVLVLRAAIGRRVGTVALAALALIGAIILHPISVATWVEAEHATAITAYDPKFENLYTCGGDVSKTKPAWSLWTFRIAGSRFDGCNRIALYRGLKRVKEIDLRRPQFFENTLFGTPVLVRNAKDPAQTVFTYVPNRGAYPIRIRVADYR